MLVCIKQALGTDVGVDLSCRQAFVTEQFLYGAQIGASVEQVRGKGMAKRVRSGQFVQSGEREILFQHSRHAARGQSGAESVQE